LRERDRVRGKGMMTNLLIQAKSAVYGGGEVSEEKLTRVSEARERRKK
jgi:hypothetical protein